MRETNPVNAGADATCYHCGKPMSVSIEGCHTAEPPRHPFEVRIVIGGETWDYVRRVLERLARYVEERDPQNCGMCSGGAGGSHSLTVVQRDITAEAFREELEQWRLNLPKR